MTIKAVLVLHGFTAQPKTVDHIAPFLHKAGWEVAIPTLRGHGGQPADLLGVHWHDWYEDALAAFTHLEATHGQGQVAVVGHSMGGVMATHLAAQGRHVPALVLVSPAFAFSNPAVKLLPLLGRMLKYWKSGPTTIRHAQLKHQFEAQHINLERFPIAAFAELFAASKIVPKGLPSIKCPTLWFHPQNDSVIPLASSQAAFAALGSHNKRFVTPAQSDHEVFWDADRDAICAQIVAFLQEVGQ